MSREPSDPSLASLRDWSRRRARGAWVWPLLALALIALMLAFALWIGLHFNHLHGYWRAVREMELGALRVPAEQSLSVMLPLWVGLGLTAYTAAVAAVLRLWWLERGWRALAQRVLDRSG
jgi:hypothetical protein